MRISAVICDVEVDVVFETRRAAMCVCAMIVGLVLFCLLGVWLLL